MFSVKNKYKNLREMLLDIKNHAILPTDEEVAIQKYEYIVSSLRSKAGRGDKLSEYVYLANSQQLVLLTEMLVSEGISVDTVHTSLKDSPYNLTASVFEEEIRLVQKPDTSQ